MFKSVYRYEYLQIREFVSRFEAVKYITIQFNISTKK